MVLKTATMEHAKSQLRQYPYQNTGWYLRRIVKGILFSKPLYLDHYSWPNALLGMGLEQQNLLELLKIHYDTWIQTGIRLHSTDNVLCGSTLLYLYEETKEEKYLKAADEIMEYLVEHPKTVSGILPYRAKQTDEVFIDTIGIVIPFLARYACARKHQRAARMATNQLIQFLEYGMDARSGLPYHGYLVSNQCKQGMIGWGRACGWFLFGMAEYLFWIKNTEYNEIFPGEYIRIREACLKFLAVVESYRLENGHFSWQLPAIEGPADSSATGLITVAILRLVQAGIMEEKEGLHFANLGLKAIATSEKNGEIMDCSAECEGFGCYPQVYASYPWSVGPAIMADALYDLMIRGTHDHH